MKMKALGPVLIAFLLTSFYGLSQDNLTFKYLSVEQGLPNNNVHSIMQDYKGFMWFGIWGEGLCRYDGYNFKLYQTIPNDQHSLSHNWPNVIYEDSDQNLWIGTQNGLNLYNRKLDNFTRFLTVPPDQGTEEAIPILSIYEDSKKRLWVGHRGLSLFQKEDSLFRRYHHSPSDLFSLSGENVRDIFEDRENNLWVACHNGLNLYKEGTNNFVRYPPPDDLTREISSVWIDGLGQFWVGTYGQGLWLFNKHTGEYTDYRDKIKIIGDHNEFINYIPKIFEDSRNNLWILTDGSGLGLWDRVNQQLFAYTYDPFLNGALSSNNISAIFEDQKGNLWIGSNGVCILTANQYNFKRYYNHPLKKNSLSHDKVSKICQDSDNNLWIGTDGGGVNLLNLSKQEFTHFRHHMDDPNSLSNDKAIEIMIDKEGWVWTGHWGSGITKFHPKKGHFIQYVPGKENSHFLSGIYVRGIHQDRNGNFWIATENGLDFYNKSSNYAVHYPDEWLFDILEDRTGKIWVAGHTGLKYLDSESEKLITVVKINASSIYEDRKGNLWLATFQDGLIKYDPDSQKITQFDQNKGFPSDNCNGVIEDNNGVLWVGSSKGLLKLDPETETLTNLGQKEDDPVKLYFRPLLKTDDGFLYFGGTKGIIAFHPDSIKDSSLPSTPIFTDFQLFNKKVPIGKKSPLKASISETKEIVLNHKESVFSIEYASVNFDEQENIEYAFTLEGFDKDWREVGSQRMATYTNLDPGAYTFKVKATNQNSIWNENEASLRITILPPPWKTWWAYSLYGITAIALLLLARSQVIQRERLKSKMQLEHQELEKIKELDQLKSRFFANISHEFRTPLTLIQGPVKSLLNGSFKGNVKEVYQIILRNSERVLQLINQLLDLAKLEAGKLQLQASQNDLIGFIKEITSSYTSLAQSRRITFVQHLSYDILLMYFDPEMLKKAINNLFSNAFKFTPEGGVVSLIITKHSPDETQIPQFKEGFVKIGVQDTGPGIPSDQVDKIFDRFYQIDSSPIREQEGSGIGLALTRQLVGLHHGKIIVESQPGEGALFEIQLPLGKSHLKAAEINGKHGPTPIEPAGWETIDKEREVPGQGEIEGYEESTDDTKPIILIVDDNSDLRSFIKNLLIDDYQVEEAENGEQGLEMGVEIIPDLIITDVMMPKMDGVELCQRFKADQKTSHIPIIILTAKAESKSKLEGLQTGADAYLVKPFDDEELLVRVKHLIEQRQKLRELFSHEVKLQPKDIAITPADETFLNKIMEIVEDNMGDETFSVEKLGQEFGMSRSQIHRKLKALTNQSATELIRNFRLKRGMDLLKQQAGTVAEVAYSVGFNSPVYFTKCFHKRYGYPPGKVKKLKKLS